MAHYIDEHTLVLDEEDTVMVKDPLPDISPKEIRKKYESVKSTRELVEIYAAVHNKLFWDIFDLDDYKKDTEEYRIFFRKLQRWEKLLDDIEDKVMNEANKEHLLISDEEISGIYYRMEPFMKKYGFVNGCGWWISQKE